MSLKQAYMRKFVILDEQKINYLKAKNQKPKGHAKLEVRGGKGKLTLNVDGLNTNISDEKIYRGFIISNDNLKLTKIDVGSIILNNKGRGSLEWQFNPSSVGDTGVSIEKFNVILVKLCSKNRYDDELVIPLAGHIHDSDSSVASILKELEKVIKNENKPEQGQYQKKEKELEIKKKSTNIQAIQPKEAPIIEDSNEINQRKVEKLYVEEVQKETEKVQEIDREEAEYLDKKTELVQQTEEEEADYEEAESVEEIHEEEEADYEETESVEEIYEAEEADYEEAESVEEIYEAEEADYEEAESVEEIQEAEEAEEEIEQQKAYEDQVLQSKQINTYNYSMYNDSTYGHSINRSNTYIENARNYSKQITNYAMNILKFFDRVNPFKEPLEGYKWWKIEYDRENIYRGFLPFYNYLVNMYYPYPFMTKITTCQSLIKKYNHYIFGVVEDQNEVQYYVYGVPGRFTREDQPFNGATGFTTWLRDQEKSKEDMGYWLIYIDALSGKIITPLNPTMPPK